MTDIIGTADADDLSGTSGSDSITGLGGNDLISGGGGSNTLDGGAGDDIITAGTGFDPDTLIGGDGNDGLIASASGLSSLDGGADNDTLIGGGTSDTLLGGDGDDALVSGGSQNLLDGGAGEDALFTLDQNGEQTLVGGAGADTFVINVLGEFTGVTISDFDINLDTLNLADSPIADLAELMAATSDDGFGGVTVALNGFSSIMIPNITPAELFGANITFSSVAAPVITAVAIEGTVNAETLTGTAFGEVISGNEGDDSINGGSGDDTLRGDEGNDTLQGGALGEFGGSSADLDNDLIEGGEGNDNLIANGGADTLNGGAGNDVITLSNASDDSVIIIDDNSSDLINGLSTTITLDFSDTEFTSRAQVIAAAREADGNILIEFSNGNTLTLQGINLSLLNNLPIMAGVQTPGQLFENDTSNDIGENGDNGNELFTGGAGDDTIDADFGNDTLNGGAGNDSLNAGSGEDTLSGDDGNDTLLGGTNDDILNGGAGDDFLVGGDVGADTLDGGSGVNVLTGGGGSLTNTFLINTPGSVNVITDFAPFEDMVQISLGGGELNQVVVENSLQGTNIRALIDDGTVIIFQGLDLNSFLTDPDLNFPGSGIVPFNFIGDFSDQTFEGSDSTDTLNGGGGNDTLTGGDGADTFIIPAPQPLNSLFGINELVISDFLVSEDIINFANTGLTDIDALTAITSEVGNGVLIDFGEQNTVLIENVSLSEFLQAPNIFFGTVINGTNTNDLIIGTGDSEIIAGGDGDDTLIGLSGSDTLIGGDNDDNLQGDGDADVLRGEDGSDTLDGGVGADSLDGGIGDDVLTGGQEADVLEGGAGNDNLNGGGEFDVLNGGSGNDTLTGEIGNDSLNGGDGEDSLEGGDGDDTLNGGLGEDTLNGGDDNDDITSSMDFGATDQVSGGNGNDTLRVGSNDVANGGSGSDLILATGSNNTLDGGEGNDTISSGNGDTRITLGDGQDLIQIQNITSDTTITITDFSAREQVSSLDAFIVADQLDLTGTGINSFEQLQVLFSIATETFPGSSGGSTISVIGLRLDTTVNGSNVGIIFDLRTPSNINTINGFLADPAGLIQELGLTADNFVFDAALPPIVGTDVSELLTGAELAEILNGLGGNDTLRGNGGNDTLDGGAGNDVSEGGDGDDNIAANEGDNTITGGGGADTAVVASTETPSVNFFTDFTPTVDLIDFSNITIEQAGFDITNPTVLANQLSQVGGSTQIQVGNNTLVFNNIAPTAFDVSDFIFAGQTLTSTEINNVLVGSGGDDTFTISDVTSGVFVVVDTLSSDTIVGFRTGVDQIDLQSSGFATADDLIAALSENTGGLVIDLGNGETLVLEGLSLADLLIAPEVVGGVVQSTGLQNPDDFIFDDEAQIDGNLIGLLQADADPFNTPPEGMSEILETDEDTPLVIQSGDFGFSDADGDMFAEVRIDAAPAGLTLGGVQVVGGQVIAVGALAGNNLVYTSPADENGDSFADITFSVSDGEDFDLLPNTLTIDVTPVNDAPEGGDITLDGTEDTPLVISGDDFLFTDVDEGDALSAIRIEETLSGLTFDGTAVEAGDVISVEDINLGLLAYTPPTNSNGEGLATFEFRVGDGAAFEATPSVATINITPVNDAPVAADISLASGETGVTVLDIVGAGVDVDGDDVTLSLGGASTLGTLEVLDATTGVISFTPNADAVDLFEGETRTETVSFTIDDGNGGTDTADIVITVEGEGTMSVTPVAVVENDAGADVATLATIADFPFVAGDVFTVDDARFVVSGAGVVSLAEGVALDFEVEPEVDIVVTRVRGADGTTETLEVTISVIDEPAGSAQDGFISGALVFADANGNGVFDGVEVAATTDASGNFELGAGATGPVIIQGGINPLTGQQAVDISTGLDFNGTLSAPEGSTVVTPLTTLINEIAVANGGDAAAIAAAETAVGNAFGIDPSVDLTTFDPIRAALAGDADGIEVFAAGSQVLSTVVLASSVVEGASSDADLDADGSAFGALADVISGAGGGAVDLTDNATVTDLVNNTATDADATAVVSADVVTAATTTITGTNTAAQAAVADGANTNIDTLTEVTQAAVVAQGDAATTVAAASGGDAAALTTAQTTFGTDLTTTVTNAAVGTIVPNLVFTGTSGDEVVTAGGGDDTLRGLGGDDTLAGGGGVDTFVVADDGSDTITDFDTDGGEVIDLTDTDTFSLNAAASGADTVITLGNGETLTLEGVTPGDLADSNFTFDTNAAPTASGATLSGDPDDTFTITLTNLGFADADGDELASVTITSLPSSGTLTLAGADIATVPQAVTVAQIVGGQLVFTPDGGGTVDFGFTVNDGTADSTTTTVSFVITAPSTGGSDGSSGSDSGSNAGDSGSGGSSGGGSPSGGSTSDPDVVVRDDGVSVVTGGNTADVFTGSDDVEDIELGGGNDRTDAGGGNDTVRGGDGDDTISGGAGADFLRGDDGNDSISGGNGDDRSFAGPDDTGDDTVEGNAGNDVIGAGAGDDLIVGGDIGTNVFGGNVNPAGSDTLFGGAGNDFIVAGAFNPGTNTVVNTGSGDNVIYSSTGNDTLFGDDANDTLGGGDGSDSITGGDGSDIIYGGIGSPTDNADTLDGGAGDDQIFASFDDDLITAGEGNDTVFGGNGNDIIDGGEGNDLIYGSAGDDTITGGTGNDTFSFVTGFGNDTISDFSTTGDDTDMLDFSEIEGLVLADLLSAATFDANGATLTIGTHGTITLEGIDQTELQTIFDNGQVVVDT
ncbi:beta strand repeat-containing protein [Kordiimonas aquimaris]|uniref:beta strand repeat-containing protein n=1 Tax=Kordiimonas aquimaris TaxID=707591 RepID=UPI0021D3462F|nr:Ig-like domain-containing protein [Kordiimonas aquimaris]